MSESSESASEAKKETKVSHEPIKTKISSDSKPNKINSLPANKRNSAITNHKKVEKKKASSAESESESESESEESSSSESEEKDKVIIIRLFFKF